ncbi:DUF5671 domain-containing protein [Glutamicibacter sp. PS]|uniref:DUF5671 domain-containing protein n=1 Tax=Glutamicibacter sp. PS TaxID=3075634 RepID=UPI0028521883|nr:DUF5671 domain-containing protein [Glutamicibacter sp. PS]MDR4533486.1 DUF5671 domain-containing protein [Glutamicibacter sp. PS]
MNEQATATSSGLGVVRRLVAHGLLLTLLLLAASGLSKLATSVLTLLNGRPDVEHLPVGLAQAIIAPPLAWLLWRWLRRSLPGARGADGVIWALQSAAIYLIALITSSVTLLGMISDVLDGDNTQWPRGLGVTLGYGALWFWQYHVLKRPAFRPDRPEALSWVLGNTYAMVLTAGVSLSVLRQSLEILFGGLDEPILVGSYASALRSAAVFALGGALIWWWHWRALGAKENRRGFATVLLLLAGLVLPALTALLSLATVISLLLPLPPDGAAWWLRILDGAPLALAGAVIGLFFWVFHWNAAALRPPKVRTIGEQVLSGISLTMTATGVGVLINALLAGWAPPLIGEGPAGLVRSGLALVVVGAAVWVRFFRPLHQPVVAERRIYLVLVFGLSSVVALSALLIVGYRVFDHILAPSAAEQSLLGLVRAPLGWLLATVLVAAYHFVLWRHDRALAPASGNLVPRRVLLIAPASAEPLWRDLQALPNVRVRWLQSEGSGSESAFSEDSIHEVRQSVQLAETDLVLFADTEHEWCMVKLRSTPW